MAFPPATVAASRHLNESKLQNALDLPCPEQQELGLTSAAALRVRVTGHSLGGALAMLQLSLNMLSLCDMLRPVGFTRAIEDFMRCARMANELRCAYDLAHKYGWDVWCLARTRLCFEIEVELRIGRVLFHTCAQHQKSADVNHQVRDLGDSTIG